MKCLVTGAGGYIGSILCDILLSRGNTVLATDNFNKGNCNSLIPYITNRNFRFQFLDVTDPQSCDDLLKSNDIEAVFHLAGMVGLPICDKRWGMANAVNSIGTYNIVEACKKVYRRPALIYSNTGSVYGRLDTVCTEDSATNPQSIYGCTKLFAEKYVLDYEYGLSVRFATLMGISPNMRVNLLVNDLVYRAMTEKHINVFEPDAKRTFLHVRDGARALVMFAQKLWSGDNEEKVYNIGDDSLNHTKREIAERIAKKTGCKVSYESTAMDGDLRDYLVCYDRCKAEGFSAEITLDETIDELIKCIPLLRLESNYQ